MLDDFFFGFHHDGLAGSGILPVTFDFLYSTQGGELDGLMVGGRYHFHLVDPRRSQDDVVSRHAIGDIELS